MISNYECNQPRRSFLGTAALTMAAAQLGMIGSAASQSVGDKLSLPAFTPGTNTSFNRLLKKQVFEA
jgi:hypothetical protein